MFYLIVYFYIIYYIIFLSFSHTNFQFIYLTHTSPLFKFVYIQFHFNCKFCFCHCFCNRILPSKMLLHFRTNCHLDIFNTTPFDTSHTSHPPPPTPPTASHSFAHTHTYKNDSAAATCMFRACICLHAPLAALYFYG